MAALKGIARLNFWAGCDPAEAVLRHQHCCTRIWLLGKRLVTNQKRKGICLMAPRKTEEKMTEEKICQHIQTNMEQWLFVGHVAHRHINAPAGELLARLGKYNDDGKFITCASSFVDRTGGDDIVQGLISSLQGRAGRIMDWLCCGGRATLKLHFGTFPDGVGGISCAIGDNTVSAAGGYIVILCKNEQFPFYLLNTYPVR